jgi:DNA-binding NarL/FixJ family response regulator
MLHSDHYGRRKDVDELDRNLLTAFAEAFRLVLSRAALNDRLFPAQNALRLASSSLVEASGGIHRMPVIRIDRKPGEGEDGLVVRTGPHVSSRAALPSSLTSRELDVLKLLAEGRTNTAIARELSIADNTVKQHVTHVLRKLGVTNRSEAVARWFHSEDGRAGSPVG